MWLKPSAIFLLASFQAVYVNGMPKPKFGALKTIPRNLGLAEAAVSTLVEFSYPCNSRDFHFLKNLSSPWLHRMYIGIEHTSILLPWVPGQGNLGLDFMKSLWLTRMTQMKYLIFW